MRNGLATLAALALFAAVAPAQARENAMSAKPIVYFPVGDIDAVLKRARARGAKILFDKKDVGAFGFVAEVEDSEGNRIALSAPK